VDKVTWVYLILFLEYIVPQKMTLSAFVEELKNRKKSK